MIVNDLSDREAAWFNRQRAELYQEVWLVLSDFLSDLSKVLIDSETQSPHL